MRLEDNIAIVTGAGSGIGRAACTTFVREGVAVGVADIDPARTMPIGRTGDCLRACPGTHHDLR